jgi:hypothetical protein
MCVPFLFAWQLVYALVMMKRRHRAATGGAVAVAKKTHADSHHKSASVASHHSSSSIATSRDCVTSTTTQQVDTSARQLSFFVVGMSVWYAACMMAPSLLFLVRLSRVELFHPEKDVAAAVMADCLVVASAAANFFFYFLLWRHFRHTFLAVFCKRRCLSADLDSSSHSYGMSASHQSQGKLTSRGAGNNSGGTVSSYCSAAVKACRSTSSPSNPSTKCLTQVITSESETEN